MTFKVLTVGRLKEAFFREAVTYYAEVLSKKQSLTMIEVADEKAPETLSDKEMTQIKDKEGERLLEKIESKEYVVALAIDGVLLKPEALAKKVNRLTQEGITTMTFVIGGSLGLSDAVLARANEQISFGKATLPHQLMKVVLLSHLSTLS